ncbi:unnamed protein product, partial [Rotaria sp. Silwood1]
MGPTQVAREQQ